MAKIYELYAIMCLVNGKWKRIGQLHRKREVAQSWRSFCRKAIYARRSKIAHIKIELKEDGRPTDAAKKMMSDKYNMEIT